MLIEGLSLDSRSIFCRKYIHFNVSLLKTILTDSIIFEEVTILSSAIFCRYYRWGHQLWPYDHKVLKNKILFPQNMSIRQIKQHISWSLINIATAESNYFSDDNAVRIKTKSDQARKKNLLVFWAFFGNFNSFSSVFKMVIKER